MSTSGKILLVAVVALLLIGVVMLFSASPSQAEAKGFDAFYYIKRQLLWLAVGLAAMAAGAKFDIVRFTAGRWRWVLYCGVIACLLAVFAPVVGLSVKGAHRWIRLGPATFQPSEIAKFALIVFLAGLFAELKLAKETYFGKIRKAIVLPGVAFLLLAVPLVLEPDYGTTILMAMTTCAMMFVAGAPVFPLVLMGLVGASGMAFIIWHNPERVGRLLAFLDPEAHAADDAYQLLNSIYGFAIGGMSGKGLAGGIQKLFYLPEAHTDFIFAVIAEEMGIAGTLLVLVLFGVVCLCGYRIAGRARTLEGRYVAFGITTLITLQAFLNMGVVTGQLPTKGLPLPFISYGGTSLAVTLLMTGVLLHLSGKDRTPLAARGRNG
jgi:cell division protein FtsW